MGRGRWSDYLRSDCTFLQGDWPNDSHQAIPQSGLQGLTGPACSTRRVSRRVRGGEWAAPSRTLTLPRLVGGQLEPLPASCWLSRPLSCQGLLTRAPTGRVRLHSSWAGAWVGGSGWHLLVEAVCWSVGAGPDAGVRLGDGPAWESAPWVRVWFSFTMTESGDLSTPLPPSYMHPCLSFPVHGMDTMMISLASPTTQLLEGSKKHKWVWPEWTPFVAQGPGQVGWPAGRAFLRWSTWTGSDAGQLSAVACLPDIPVSSPALT